MALVAVMTLTLPWPAQGQSAATVAPSDPVYADLGRLEAFGLVPRGSGGAGPWSAARIAWIVRDARVLAAVREGSPAWKEDVEAILDRLAARFPIEDPGTPAGMLELEAGGGRSPGRITPDLGLNQVDAVVNPLWMGQRGRAYGDRGTVAAAGRGSLPLGPAIALMAGGRTSWRSSTGDALWGSDVALETLALRAEVGSLALEVGRDHIWTSDGSARGMALSGNGPPLDQIRFGTDRPLPLRLLGETEMTLFVADLGASQRPPHAKLFGFVLTSRPVPAVEWGLTLLNKQFGDGAPEASVSDRLKDLTWVADWFRPGVTEFSDKLAEVSVRLTPGGGGVSAFVEAVLNDFDHDRLRHTFQGLAAYRVGFGLPRLGASGRHALAAEGTWIGPGGYLHHQFKSGHAARGFPMGSYLGPDGRSVRLMYGYHPAARGWSAEMGMTLDDLHGDRWRPGDDDEDGPQRVAANPDEVRLRGELDVRKTLSDGRAGVAVSLGVERVSSYGFQSGDDRLNGAALVRFWRVF